MTTARDIESVPTNELEEGLQRVAATSEWLAQFEAKGAVQQHPKPFPEQKAARDMLLAMHKQITDELLRRQKEAEAFQQKPS